jgi:Skp family chaperone for outer membrane proteins
MNNIVNNNTTTKIKKMSKRLILIALVIFGLGSINASAQSNLKFAHFDYQKATDSIPSINMAQQSLKEYEQEINEILMELQSNYENLIKTYQADTLSTLRKQRLEEDIQILGQTIQAKNEEYQVIYQNRVAEIMTPIDDNLKQAVKNVADKHKLNYVFEETTLMYVNGGMDLTREIKTELIRLEKIRMGS